MLYIVHNSHCYVIIVFCFLCIEELNALNVRVVNNIHYAIHLIKGGQPATREENYCAPRVVSPFCVNFFVV